MSKIEILHLCPSSDNVNLKILSNGWKRTVFCDSFVSGFKMADILWSWQCKYHKSFFKLHTFWLLTASPSSKDWSSSFFVTYLRLIFVIKASFIVNLTKVQGLHFFNSFFSVIQIAGHSLSHFHSCFSELC